MDKTVPKFASIFHEFPATPCLNGMSTSREGDGAWLETKRVARNLSKINTTTSYTNIIAHCYGQIVPVRLSWTKSTGEYLHFKGDSLGSECHKHQSWQRALPWNVLQTVATMPVGWEVFVHAALHVNAILTVKMGIVALALRMVAKGAYLRSSIGNRGRGNPSPDSTQLRSGPSGQAEPQLKNWNKEKLKRLRSLSANSSVLFHDPWSLYKECWIIWMVRPGLARSSLVGIEDHRSCTERIHSCSLSKFSACYRIYLCIMYIRIQTCVCVCMFHNQCWVISVRIFK